MVAPQEGQCVAGADYPSCLTVLFDRGGEPRIQSAAAGRGKLGAFVALRERPRSTCGRRSLLDCTSYVDHLQVTRS